MFIKDKSARSGFRYESMDSYKCIKESVVSIKYEPKDSALAIIDTQCAFTDDEGNNELTTLSGEIYSFDGVHLTKAGAKELSDALIRSQLFRKIIGLKL